MAYRSLSLPPPCVHCRAQLGVVLYVHLSNKDRYLTLRRLMSYIYGAPILDVSRSHTTTQVRSPAEIVGSNPTGGMDICLL